MQPISHAACHVARACYAAAGDGGSGAASSGTAVEVATIVAAIATSMLMAMQWLELKLHMPVQVIQSEGMEVSAHVADRSTYSTALSVALKETREALEAWAVVIFPLAKVSLEAALAHAEALRSSPDLVMLWIASLCAAIFELLELSCSTHSAWCGGSGGVLRCSAAAVQDSCLGPAARLLRGGALLSSRHFCGSHPRMCASFCSPSPGL